jgi:hypothetical protein
VAHQLSKPKAKELKGRDGDAAHVAARTHGTALLKAYTNPLKPDIGSGIVLVDDDEEVRVFVLTAAAAAVVAAVVVVVAIVIVVVVDGTVLQAVVSTMMRDWEHRKGVSVLTEQQEEALTADIGDPNQVLDGVELYESIKPQERDVGPRAGSGWLKNIGV